MNVLVYQLAFQPWMDFLFQRFAITFDNFLWLQYSPLLSVTNLYVFFTQSNNEEFSLMFYLPGLQDVINHLIAGNRLCALCFPIAYRKVL